MEDVKDHIQTELEKTTTQLQTPNSHRTLTPNEIRLPNLTYHMVIVIQMMSHTRLLFKAGTLLQSLGNYARDFLEVNFVRVGWIP